MPSPLKKPLARIPSSLVEKAKLKLDKSLPSTFSFADDPRETQLYLRGGDSPMAKTERVELINRSRAGEFVELEMVATVFIQRDTPNYNFLRFKPGDLPSFAKSYTGSPFLADHATGEQDRRGGTIMASKLIHGDGEKLIEQRLHLVKPWAVESALDGTLDRFSIGWYRGGTSECSICEASWLACQHWPGELDEKTGKICELVQINPRGKETSYVNGPAVLGTAPASISQLEALDPALLADILAADATPGVKDDMKILAALIASLALPAGATEDEVLAAVQRQSEQLTTTRDQLTVATTANENTRNRLTALEAESAERSKLARVTVVDSTIDKLIAGGKIKPGSETELALRRMGGVTKTKGPDGKDQLTIDDKKPIDVFTAYANDLLANGASVTPVGAQLPAAKPEVAPAGASDGKAFLAVKPEVGSWLKSAGITQEQFEKHGADGRAMAAHIFGQ